MRLKELFSLFCGSLVIATTGASARKNNNDSGFHPIASSQRNFLDQLRVKLPSSSDTSNQQTPLPSQHQQQQPFVLSKRAFVANVAFWTGVGNVLCYRLHGCYANMMTGNMIRMATALGEFRLGQALLYAAMCTAYAVGHGVFRGMVIRQQDRRQSASHTLATPQEQPTPQHHLPEHTAARCQAMCLMVVLMGLSDWVFLTGQSSAAAGLHILALAAGFGLWNAACVEALGGTMVVFAMTGHMHKVSQGIVDYYTYPPGKRRWRSATKTSLRVLVYFVAGVLSTTLCATLWSSSSTGAAPFRVLSSFATSYVPMMNDFDIHRIPPFTTLGLLLAGLLQWYDLSWKTTATGKPEPPSRREPRVDVSVDRWGLPDIWFSNTVHR